MVLGKDIRKAFLKPPERKPMAFFSALVVIFLFFVAEKLRAHM